MARSSSSFQKGRPKTGGRRPGASNRVTLEVREAARQLVEDPAYRDALRRRLIRGRAPEMERQLWFYAYGKLAGAPLPLEPPRPLLDLARLDPGDWAAIRRMAAKVRPAESSDSGRRLQLPARPHRTSEHAPDKILS